MGKNIFTDLPPEVYIKFTDATIDIIQKILSPVTSITNGLGRYIIQKFENSVNIQKALYCYTLQIAFEKAKNKALKHGILLKKPVHEKSFLISLDEASMEFNQDLHNKWVNLISDQLVNENFHPNYVNILKALSPKEAKILELLRNLDDVGPNGGGYMVYNDDAFKYWLYHNDDTELKEWDYSNILLISQKLADVTGP